MIRQTLLLMVVAYMFGACHTPGPPNVLFIAVDDLRTELGVYGNPIVQSPHLDRLATEGRLFTHHYVQVPTCGASRHALLTGKYPTQQKHLSNDITAETLAKAPENTLPETFIHHFKRNGYYTVGIGKISHSADGQVYGYEEAPSGKRELPYSWDELLFDPGKWATGWNAFFAYADDENRQSRKRQVKPYEQADVTDEGYPDGLTAQLAVAKLKELKQKEQPFFLGVGFFKPHLPFTAPKKYWDMYERESIPLSPNPNIPETVHPLSLHGSGELNGYYLTDEKAGLKETVSEEYARKLRHAYFACISYVDAQIGKVLDELKKQGLDENTIVVVWGDHGWHLGDQMVWGKHTLFERALKSSLIVKVPGMLQTGVPAEGLVETIDIYPTLLELCGLKASIPLDGKSFVAQLNSPESDGKVAAYGFFRKGISMRTERYRLTKYFRKEEPLWELYDHQTDPDETKNIAREKPELVKKLMPLWEKGNTGIYQRKN
ncbi:sulfatase [Rapidithrix thailandica]|uniref:Sulfatase n=1 Tax=Rapidithrix thailandica TaxID=413964 RepID=A0AAW9SDP4_9BACT